MFIAFRHGKEIGNFQRGRTLLKKVGKDEKEQELFTGNHRASGVLIDSQHPARDSLCYRIRPDDRAASSSTLL